MYSTADALQARVVEFSLRVLRFLPALGSSPERDVVRRQLARSATAEAANYRAARRARSRAEFIAKLGTVVEEADESEHWLRVIRDAPFSSGPELHWLLTEAGELRAIFTASAKTARSHDRAR